MNNYNALINNLETLELNKIKENLDQYLNMIADGTNTTVDALYELSEMEIKFRNEQAITSIFYNVLSRGKNNGNDDDAKDSGGACRTGICQGGSADHGESGHGSG